MTTLFPGSSKPPLPTNAAQSAAQTLARSPARRSQAECMHHSTACMQLVSHSEQPHTQPRLQADPEVFATAGSDRSIALYDLRHSTPVRKLVMQTRTNALAWNPMEPLNFTAANEDCNLYSYDMRKLDAAFCVHEVRPMHADMRSWTLPSASTRCARCRMHAAGAPSGCCLPLWAHACSERAAACPCGHMHAASALLSAVVGTRRRPTLHSLSALASLTALPLTHTLSAALSLAPCLSRTLSLPLSHAHPVPPSLSLTHTLRVCRTLRTR